MPGLIHLEEAEVLLVPIIWISQVPENISFTINRKRKFEPKKVNHSVYSSEVAKMWDSGFLLPKLCQTLQQIEVAYR